MNVDDVGEVSVGLSATSSLLLSKYSPYTPMFNKGWSVKKYFKISYLGQTVIFSRYPEPSPERRPRHHCDQVDRLLHGRRRRRERERPKDGDA